MNKVATASQYIALRSTTISMISTNCDCRDTRTRTHRIQDKYFKTKTKRNKTPAAHPLPDITLPK